MSKQSDGDQGAREAGDTWSELFERSRRVSDLVNHRLREDDSFSVFDTAGMAQSFIQLAEQLLADPDRFKAAQEALAGDYARLFASTMAATDGKATEPVIQPAADDRRFKDPAWSENPLFRGIKEYYLLTGRWLEGLVDQVPGLDDHGRQRAHFFLRQMISALSPTNFIATNPKVLRAMVETGGDSLRRGFRHLLDDIERGDGRLAISLTRAGVFEPGRNLALSPGKVIHQNALCQVIQYQPATETVGRRPLLIVPPWINKYYILDLQPKNSFIHWAVAQGHTVFVLSWINPDETLSSRSFEDYMLEGPLAALDVIREATGEEEVNAIGYCIGGTLLACTLAHMAARQDRRIATATFFTTLVDFSDPGELGVFIDAAQLERLDAHLEKKGYLEGSQMAQVFSLLRENDLIWSAFVRNYLLGEEPPAFDLLHWNSDSTRMPAMMHRFYLRAFYLENRLVEPESLVLAGVPLDLRRITQPTYIVATKEDHIAPWRSCFAAVRHYRGPVRFVLGGSGHIAGVINPPTSNKYGYWAGDGGETDPDRWLSAARHTDGSWWTDWQTWIEPAMGGRVAARTPGGGALPPLEDAPGSYVLMRSDGSSKIGSGEIT